MDKKKLQMKRRKGYFIEAVKKIVKEKGIEKLTVKKVADLAGYSVGTLYNYFDDLDELLFYGIVSFFDDCKEYVLKKVDNIHDPKEKVVKLAIAYSEFFINNPNIYKLAFIKDIKIPVEKISNKNYVPEIIKISSENLKKCAEKGIIKEKHLEIILGLISNSIHGNLMFYIKKRTDITTKKEVLKKIKKEVIFLLEK
ncbi:MAG: TetR/AcrR family transcriptional regulator [Fusobacteriota bacterium]